MKNLNLLPVDEAMRSRLRRLAAFHRMGGQIAIGILTVIDTHVLVGITPEHEDLSDDELLDRARQLFASELPRDLRLHYAVIRRVPKKWKHVLTHDGTHIFRIDKPILVQPTETTGGGSAIEIEGHYFTMRYLAGLHEPLLLKQAALWFRGQVVQGFYTLPQ